MINFTNIKITDLNKSRCEKRSHDQKFSEAEKQKYKNRTNNLPVPLPSHCLTTQKDR